MIFSRELFFYLSKNDSFIYTRLFENLKARFLKSIITWSEMGQQTVQAKEIYFVTLVTYQWRNDDDNNINNHYGIEQNSHT